MDCPSCGRCFVVTLVTTDAIPYETPRRIAPLGITAEPAWQCDYEIVKATGDPATAVAAGLSQRCCPSCHTQFI
jgi:hypothetical protein